MSTIEVMEDVQRVECDPADGPGRNWDCKITNGDQEQVGERPMDHIDSFEFRSGRYPVESRGDSVVTYTAGTARFECELREETYISGDSIELHCEY